MSEIILQKIYRLSFLEVLSYEGKTSQLISSVSVQNHILSHSHTHTQHADTTRAHKHTHTQSIRLMCWAQTTAQSALSWLHHYINKSSH